MPEIRVLKSVDGKTSELDAYILIEPSGNAVSIESQSSLYDDYMGAMAMWDNFTGKLGALSDQDIFQFAKDFDLDYDALIEIAREARLHSEE